MKFNGYELRRFVGLLHIVQHSAGTGNQMSQDFFGPWFPRGSEKSVRTFLAAAVMHIWTHWQTCREM